MSLSKLDIFPKLDNEYRIGTTSGGIISLLSIISLIALSTYEIHDYLNPPIRQRLFVDSTRPTGADGVTITMQDQPRLDTFINITFPKTPCYLLHLDVIDSITQLPIPVDNIHSHFYRLSPTGENLGELDPDFLNSEVSKEPGSCYVDKVSQCYSCQEVFKAYKVREFKPPVLSKIDQCSSVVRRIQPMKNEGCSIQSNFRSVRVASEFLISPGISWFSQEGWYLHDIETFDLKNTDINLSHYIDRIQFSKSKGKLPLDHFTNIQTKAEPWRVVYTTDILGNNFSVSRYALYNPAMKFPGVVFHYDISPILATTYVDKEPRLNIITRLLTVIGGALGILRLFDSMMYSTDKEKDEVIEE